MVRPGVPLVGKSVPLVGASMVIVGVVKPRSNEADCVPSQILTLDLLTFIER